MKNRLIIKLFDLSFIFSVPFLTLLLCGNYNAKNIMIITVFSFLVGNFIKFVIWKEEIYKNFNLKYFICALLISMYTIGLLKPFCFSGANFINSILNNLLGFTMSLDFNVCIIGILSIFSMTMFVYYFILRLVPIIKDEYCKVTKVEKRFLLIVLIIGGILTTILYALTNVFYLPYHNDNFVFYDVIYTTDSGALTIGNAYLNVGMPENDLRQPLFGIMAMPFAVVANFLSMFFQFIPNSYNVIFNTIQILLVAFSFVMLAKLLGLNEKGKIWFWSISFCSYSVILFSFVAEQYIFAFFYLILAIYVWYYHLFEINYFYIASVGSLLTSGVIFPLISKFKNFKSWFINILKCFCAFMIIMILSGQLLQFFTLPEQLNKFLSCSGKELLFIDKFQQFLVFVKSIFIAPSGETIINNGLPLYHLAGINSFSLLGIIILIVCLISFVINRKNKIAKISFLWILFSFVVLCLLGWGTKENGLILYSLYFAWAFIVLIYLIIDKLFKKEAMKYKLFAIICFAMLIINSIEFYNIISFGINYYS